MRLRDILRFCVFGLAALLSAAATAGSYNPLETFAPFDMGQAPTRLSLGGRASGPAILAEPRRLQDQRDARSGDATRSPARSRSATPTTARQALDVLWLNLEQNRYRPDSRGEPLEQCRAARAHRGHVTRLCPSGAGQADRHRPADDQRHARADPAAGAARARRHGGARHRLPLHRARRSHGAAAPAGWIAANGPIYSIAQWYPRMAVYDDLRGWDTAALPRAGILSRVRRLRLFGDRPGEHDRRRLGRARRTRARCSRRPARAARRGARRATRR